MLSKSLQESTEAMAKDQNYWLQKLATLRIDRARGNPAPHKPLLLLVILEMMEKGFSAR
jgi:putative restriction endonuclease